MDGFGRAFISSCSGLLSGLVTIAVIIAVMVLIAKAF